MKKSVFILSLLIIFVLSGCNKEKETIKIGFIGTLSGNYSEAGVNTMYGVQMAVDEINENGGVDGQLFELLIRDDEADPLKAVEMQNELKELGCNVIIGHSLSLVAIEAVENANTNDTLLISPSIGTDILTGIDDKLIRIVATVYYESTSISNFMLEENPSKVMIIVNEDNNVLTQYHKSAFEDVFTNEGYAEENIIVGSFYSNNAVQIQAIKTLIESEEPDAIMIASSNTDAAPFINYIQSLEIDISIHLTSWAGTSIIDQIDTVNTSNVYLYNDFIEQNKDGKYLAYKNKFIELYHQEPDMLSTNGYDAVYMIFKALDNGAKYTAESMKEYLLEIKTFYGINDTFSIDAYGDNIRTILQYQIVDGKLVAVD